ncbi:MAG: S8 family serine peptidase, partial [Propionibacteriaceae bacterium]|nr:S8 family serine peptidase [Propionibacteriaceae bacterium]
MTGDRPAFRDYEVEVPSTAESAPRQLRDLYGTLPGARSPSLLVALIDDGVDPSHPAIAGRLEARLAIGSQGVPGSHATQVAGLIVGVPEPGFAGGLAPSETRLLDIDVRDGVGAVSSAAIADGIRIAVEHGADIVNLSLALSRRDSGIEDALAAAEEAGVIVVASTRNDVVDEASYPADYRSVIGVTSVTDGGDLAPLATLASAELHRQSHGHRSGSRTTSGRWSGGRTSDA